MSANTAIPATAGASTAKTPTSLGCPMRDPDPLIRVRGYGCLMLTAVLLAVFIVGFVLGRFA